MVALKLISVLISSWTLYWSGYCSCYRWSRWH